MAGYFATSSTNTFIGTQAGYNNTSGERNTYIGNSAGFNATTGSNNTFIGLSATSAAGASMTTGSKNTIIGGYTGNQGGLDIRTASNYIVLSDGDGNPLISTADNQTVALEGAVPNAGTGITFPATQSASSNANTLDDYEEGTWTPVIQFSGGSTGVTYGVRDATYTKIGRQVTLFFNLQLSSKGSSTGDAQLAGFPFTTGTGARGGGSITYAQTFTSLSDVGGFLLLVESGNTIATLRYFNSSTYLSQTMTNNNFQDSTEFWGQLTYFV